MAVTVAESYAACRQLVLAANSSFAVGMNLFPPASRDQVYALYAFFRRTDDLVDEEGPVAAKRARLDAWRDELHAALAGATPQSAILPAVVDTAARGNLPVAVFDGCLDACATDLDAVRLADLAALHAYCDGVAGTVGEACLRLLGYDDAELLSLSRENARAVQITNVLRDVEEDRLRDRIYLPADLLARHGVTPADLRADPRGEALRRALAELGEVAAAGYRRAEPLFTGLAPGHRPPLVALTLRYRLLLERLQAQGFAARERCRLPKSALLRVLAAAELARWMPTWRR